MAASSPRGPRGKEHLLAAIVREAMQLVIQIGQLEIGRFDRGERGAALRSGFAEIPDAVFVIMHNRLTEMAR